MHDDGSQFGDGGFFKAFMWFMCRYDRALAVLAHNAGF